MVARSPAAAAARMVLRARAAAADAATIEWKRLRDGRERVLLDRPSEGSLRGWPDTHSAAI